ncbi:hypothetical protein N7466_009834 [Penicillium verhagenii]|uniref:uncharacterized protein n=1 Tax=Penicillium verhagenii TaxID=1562060 RepID=UPI002544FA7D|nr:uncharacterized protein N7466_009834 [Penicillium verhagenii]KAJ5921508.1 hypothetical protein N7466_009834 [Penicillium verhagenii]
MNIWNGTIDLSPEHHLEGIRLVDPTSHWQSDLTKNTKLGLRSFVNPALIPLHARAGPSLELHTTSTQTSQWLQRKLSGTIWLNEDELDLPQSLQCPVGLLVSVDGTSSKRSGATTSDLLVYGVLSSATSCTRPPTPPHSSPNETNGRANTSTTKPYQLRIYAAPLSTQQVTQAHAFPSPPPSYDGERAPAPAQFLPDCFSPSPKRKRVATLFESAAQHHRRVRQGGGGAVSQLMASSRPSSSSQNLPSLRAKREPEDETPSLPSLDRLVSGRSRSMSLGTNLTRPGSTRSARATPGISADPQKRAPTPNPFLDSRSRRVSQQMQPQSLPSVSTEENTTVPASPPKNPESIIAENKNVITRTILTCMRLYGFHRSSKRPSASKSTSEAVDPDLETSSSTAAPEGLRAETPAPGASADDDEFKDMYHATYKAAAFALRKYVKDLASSGGNAPQVLEKEKAMTCIDEILRIFCEGH